MTAIVLWGSQLTIEYHSALVAYPDAPVIMIESQSLSAKFKYHKQKLRFVLTAMRDYADELRSTGRTVWYSDLETSDFDWFETLSRICHDRNVTELIVMRQNDKTPQRRLEARCRQSNISLAITPNTMFLTPTAVFNEWAEGQKRLQMEQFYRWQRRRLNILIDHGKPTGGKWNYDAENRQPLPKNHLPPELNYPVASQHVPAVEALITEYFNDHPGQLAENWLPTNRLAARQWLTDFIEQRFVYFGKYEDAMQSGQTFLYHSALSALLNIGLLHPSEVIATALAAGDTVPLAAKEGFIRQIIGWREFMFGLYHYKPDDWIDSNFLEQERDLPSWWWQLDNAPEPPLQDALQRLEKYGYTHHIERLMVFGNYMLLADYNPRQVYNWFMTMFVDAYEWVMVPNVIGMSQYADGGLDHGGFASKPYISGSNYLQKMGKWWPSTADAKESEWTKMYWEFLLRHQAKLETNHRLRPLYHRFK